MRRSLQQCPIKSVSAFPGCANAPARQNGTQNNAVTFADNFQLAYALKIQIAGQPDGAVITIFGSNRSKRRTQRLRALKSCVYCVKGRPVHFTLAIHLGEMRLVSRVFEIYSLSLTREGSLSRSLQKCPQESVLMGSTWLIFRPTLFPEIRLMWCFPRLC